MKIIKVSTNLQMTLHDFPEGTYEQQNEYLRSLIGNGCRMYELVLPRRLYSELHMREAASNIPGQCVSMLMDEEALLKKNVKNDVGSYLYETDKHGHPIMGNILFVGNEWREEWTDEWIDFCGIEESVQKDLEEKLNNMIRIMERTKFKRSEQRRSHEQQKY